MTLRKCGIEMKIILNGVAETAPPLNLSTPENRIYILTRMTSGFTHQWYNGFTKGRNKDTPLAEELNSVKEYGELPPTSVCERTLKT